MAEKVHLGTYGILPNPAPVDAPTTAASVASHNNYAVARYPASTVLPLNLDVACPCILLRRLAKYRSVPGIPKEYSLRLAARNILGIRPFQESARNPAQCACSGNPQGILTAGRRQNESARQAR